MKSITTLVAAAFAMTMAATVQAQPTIYGTMSNFDVFNQTTTNAYGAEMELEGVHSNEVINFYPSHYSSKTLVDYSTGITFGTRITFNGYTFDPSGYLAPTVGQSTNGHYCVDIPGCEHFGFEATVQPTATRYFWLDHNSQRIGTSPLSIPTPTWTVQPPVGGGQPVVVAQVQAPKAEVQPQFPDSIWMKIYVTELERPVGLEELISNGAVVPDSPAEQEIEWELLEGAVPAEHEAELGDGQEAVIRRYEFFQYTGAYTEEHEPLSAFVPGGEPPPGELGPFIAANMAAVNFAEVPEPGSASAAALGIAILLSRRRWSGLHHQRTL